MAIYLSLYDGNLSVVYSVCCKSIAALIIFVSKI